MEITLQDPFDFAGRNIAKFTLREPKAKDMRSLPIEVKVGDLLDLGARLANSEKAVFNELSARDAMTVVAEVSSFLAPGL